MTRSLSCSSSTPSSSISSMMYFSSSSVTLGVSSLAVNARESKPKNSTNGVISSVNLERMPPKARASLSAWDLA